MQWRSDPFFHLTYCTNIHAGESWDEVLSSIRAHSLPLKQSLAPDRPFGLGLRLSDLAAAELLEGDRLAEFRTFLEEHNLYVAIINGFPFGAFHNRVIKEDVFAPDWRTEERVQYTLRLVQILSALLPAGLDGGISTSPLSYKAWVRGGESSVYSVDEAALEAMIRNLVRVVEPMVRLRRDSGQFIHLDIEPEPDGLIENSPETVAFYEHSLLPVGAPILAEALGISMNEARQHLLDHIQICYDTCHFAVGFEDTETVLKRFFDAGIQIGRIQISSALKVLLPPDTATRSQIQQSLEPFAESTYLHQVLERREAGPLHHFPDLPAALPEIQNPQALEWRIHYHVPLFVEDYGAFGSTQAEILPVLDAVEKTRFTRHLEIETYTWDVLPAHLKLGMHESIHREYRWVIEQFPED